MNYRRFYLILTALTASISLSAGAYAAKQGVQLSGSELAVVNKVQCGLINNRWIAGKLKKGVIFYSYSSSLKLAIKQLKGAKTTSEKAKLILQIESLKKRIKSGNKTCKAAASVVTPTPTVTPTPSPTATVIPPDAVTILWNENATTRRGQNGSNFSFYCPPGGTLGTVYGTNTYTDDSSICSAAVHMGLFTTATGGYPTIQIKEGQSLYYGDVRNGVTSYSYGNWSGSYILVDYPSFAAIIKTPLNPVKWSDSANNLSLNSRLGETFDFTCSANGTFTSIWGTDTYTSDSGICTAAVHAGRINRVNGGAIRIRIQAGAASYTASSRNGVTSSSYGSYATSYVFVD
jgi:hypothetical protein